MLALRPSCEHCDTDLPPAATNAMICSYECTFCAECVNLLEHVCPNCGGGFQPRPIRPLEACRPGTGLAHHPAAEKRVHKPVDLAAHRIFVARLERSPSNQR